MKPSLLILAAGMGSRYGGLKQLETYGPGQMTLMEYSVYDAVSAGIDRVVFVIREGFAADFEELVAKKLRSSIEVVTVFQRLENLPVGFQVPQKRSKPWGTAHAVLTAKHALNGPFVMVNADDYYGPEAFRLLASFFRENQDPLGCAMAGYRLAETLSENGAVTRAVCGVDGHGMLTEMTELKKIFRAENGRIEGGQSPLGGDELVSMNCFGFQSAFLPLLEEKFSGFLGEHALSETAECLIPDVVGQLVRDKRISVKLLKGAGNWLGVTYPEDKERVRQAMEILHALGLYGKATALKP